MRVLLIDDIRDLKADVIARNYFDGIRHLKDNGPWDLVLLDHDLASYDENKKEKTGYDIMCWLEEHTKYLPAEIQLVTSNPVGRKRMQQVIDKLSLDK